MPFLDHLSWFTSAFAVLLLLAILGAIEGGKRLAAYERKRRPEREPLGIGAVDSSVFALLGLLLAFAFSGATSRFDARRELIVQEANAIGTAYLRVDLLSEASQAQLRPLYRKYVEERLDTYAQPTLEARDRSYQGDVELQNRIWQTSVAAISGLDTATRTLVVVSLNDMIDITTTRLAASYMHPPSVIYAMLCLLCLIAAFLTGHGLSPGPRSWLHWVSFALVMSLTVFLIVDIEFPRLGFIRVDDSDQLLRDVLASMK